MQSFLPTELKEVTLINRRATRAHVIDAGQQNAFNQLINGENLSSALKELIAALEEAIRGAKCSIMLCDEDTNTLSLFVGPNIPPTYAHAMYSFAIDERNGANAKAAYYGHPEISTDISKGNFWEKYKTLASNAKLAACWSYPIIAPSKKLLGTFSLYFEHPLSPSEENLRTLEKEANIAAIMMDKSQHIEALHKAERALQKQVASSTTEIEASNRLLSKALDQRNSVQKQLVEMENMASLGMMMSSLTHEINTPVGISITAISHLNNVQKRTREKLETGKLSRSELVSMFDEIDEATFIVENNLKRSTELIQTFKQLSLDQHGADIRYFNVCDYIDEILLSLKPHLKNTNIKFCIDVKPDINLLSYPGAFSQILINLIMNSTIHAFSKDQSGHIVIKVTFINGELCLDYSDNGRGMSQHTIDNIYKPYFTLGQKVGGSGLGMHVCYNLIVKLLKGTIDCDSALGKGVTFKICFPQSSQSFKA